MAGALIGSAFADARVPTHWHLFTIAVLSIPLAVAAGWALPVVAPFPRAQGGGRFPFALPSLGMIGLVTFAFGAVMGEVAARNWSAVYLRDVLFASPGAAGFGYDPVFLVPRLGKTAAELPAEVKNEISHRGQALRLLVAALKAGRPEPNGGRHG